MKNEEVFCSEDDDVEHKLLILKVGHQQLIKAFGEFNGARKQAVHDLGFGHLIELQIMDIPEKLGFWVLDKYDSMSYEIIINQRKRIYVNEESVQVTLGFPRG